MSSNLAGELTALLGTRLTINAADQAHFGCTRVYGAIDVTIASESVSSDTKADSEVASCENMVSDDICRELGDLFLEGSKKTSEELTSCDEKDTVDKEDCSVNEASWSDNAKAAASGQTASSDDKDTEEKVDRRVLGDISSYAAKAAIGTISNFLGKRTDDYMDDRKVDTVSASDATEAAIGTISNFLGKRTDDYMDDRKVDTVSASDATDEAIGTIPNSLGKRTDDYMDDRQVDTVSASDATEAPNEMISSVHEQESDEYKDDRQVDTVSPSDATKATSAQMSRWDEDSIELDVRSVGSSSGAANDPKTSEQIVKQEDKQKQEKSDIKKSVNQQTAMPGTSEEVLNTAGNNVLQQAALDFQNELMQHMDFSKILGPDELSGDPNEERTIKDVEVRRQSLMFKKTFVKLMLAGPPTPTSWPTMIGADGNLTFSLAFARLFEDREIVCCVHENFADFLKKYPASKDLLAELLRMAPRVTVVMNVDATRFRDFPHQLYGRIIIPLPYNNCRAITKKSQRLLYAIIGNLQMFMAPFATMCIVVPQVQSELWPSFSKYAPLVRRSEAFSSPDAIVNTSSWNLIHMAGQHWLSCLLMLSFYPSTFVGYRNSNGDTDDCEPGITYCFEKKPKPIATPWPPFMNLLTPYYQRDLAILKFDGDETLWSVYMERLSQSHENIVELREIAGMRTIHTLTQGEVRVYRLKMQFMEIQPTVGMTPEDLVNLIVLGIKQRRFNLPFVIGE